MSVFGPPCSLIFAVETAERLTAREWDWPESPTTWLVAILLGGLLIAWVCRIAWRDTAELSLGWRIGLLIPRLAVLAGLLIVALNPQERTQELAQRPSRVVLVADTSLSMRHPSQDGETGSPSEKLSRADAVRKLLAETPLLEELRKTHEVTVYRFDSLLDGPVHVFPQKNNSPKTPSQDKPSATPTPATPPEAPVDWNKILEPKGLETRLGEALTEIIGKSAGSTLSGVVLLSDGGQNAGIDTTSAYERARAAGMKLITVGVGGTATPLNLAVTDLQAPTEVQFEDNFDLTAFLVGQGIAGRSISVELQEQRGEEPPVPVETRTIEAGADGVPVAVPFSLNPKTPGTVRYTVKATFDETAREMNADDNTRAASISVFDRPTRVLLVAGGPMREYHFVRNLLYRHKSFDVDVYLQTATVGTSQESDNLLLTFPETREGLFAYDIIVCFDPDWRLLPTDAFVNLRDWVSQEAGGLVLIAGDVNTPQLAAMGGEAATGAETQQQAQPLKELLPVVLGSYFTAARFDQDASQPWPISFTDDAKTVEFLQLTDDPLTSTTRWKEFPGVFRCYPTTGIKAGATVYARFSDPRTQFDAPVLMASQFFGQGRVFYLGSGEMWRMRSVSDADYDRFWIKLCREVSQGRSKRGTRRGLLLPETRKALLGQTVNVRARLLDSQFVPLTADSVPLDIYDPQGRALSPGVRLAKDPARPGEYAGAFRATLPGAYRLNLAVPESRESIQEEVTVAIPRLEDDDPRQNVALLAQLASETGGESLTIENAAEKLPALLVDRGEPFLIDQRLKTLWDRPWVMVLLVGLLSMEWLLRKLLKLA